MKKRNWIVAITTAIALAGAGLSAAVLSNFSGQSCGDLEGTWHFVNNQVPDGSPAGTLTAEFTSGTQVVGPSSINNNTQHFHVIASGSLINASTNLGGRLVLSDFSCSGDGKEEPPKEPDPKK